MRKLKINANFKLDGREYKKGSVIDIKVDSVGNPINSFWARRLRDSVLDGCVEILEEKNIKLKKKIKGSSDDSA